MIRPAVMAELFGRTLNLTGARGSIEFAWHTKSAQVLALLLCYGNTCSWEKVLEAVWGEVSPDTKSAYHTLQASLNKRLAEVHTFSGHPLRLAANRISLDPDVRPLAASLVLALFADELKAPNESISEELRKSNPSLFLGDLDEVWANKLRNRLRDAREALDAKPWDCALPSANHLHGGMLREFIDGATSDLTFVATDLCDLLPTYERPLLDALERGVFIWFLQLDTESKMATDKCDPFLDEAVIARCRSSMAACEELRRKWSGNANQLRKFLHEWSPKARLLVADGNSKRGRMAVTPCVSRPALASPTFCLSWKEAGTICAEYCSATGELFALSAEHLADQQ